VGFEPTTPVFEQVKTVHALDCAATVIGRVSVVLTVFISMVLKSGALDNIILGQALDTVT
jgi:hypothetical protein